jgi:hypothetical protein
MAFSRTKVLSSFALFGFLIGTAAYLIFDWIVTSNLIQVAPQAVLASPWFVSGIAGAILSTLLVVVIARANVQK